MKQRPNNLVPAVDRAIQIVQMYRSGDERFGISDSSKLLNLKKSTIFDLLNTLTYYNSELVGALDYLCWKGTWAE